MSEDESRSGARCQLRHGRQSRTMSLVEAVANVLVGFAVAVLTQILLFPVFGLAVPLADTLQIGAVFTAVSILRSYALRRLFESVRPRRPTK